MEALGLAIGVPGLCALIVQTTIAVRETLTDIRNARKDLNECIHDINVEYRKFCDWQQKAERIKDRLQLPEERHRSLIVIATLMRIASIFAQLATMENERRWEQASKSRAVDSPEKMDSWRKRLSRMSLGSTSKSQEDSSAERSPSLVDVSPFNLDNLANNVHQGMDFDEIEHVAKEVEKNVSKRLAIRWALIDRNEMEGLYRKLLKYNTQLKEITEELTGSTGLPHRSMEQHFMVPFPRNRNFVGRKEALLRLDELLKIEGGQQTRAALWGLGGAGKTSIAVEYCHSRWAKGPVTPINIFWIHGNSEATFKSSYRDISKSANLPVTGADEENDVLVVKRWLEGSSSGNWMLVVDNVDDISLGFGQYLPVVNGAILFTSRDKRILGQPNFGIPPTNGIELRSMTRTEAAALLDADIGAPAAVDSSSELCELLGDLPLAITQSAAYMRNTHTSIDQYITLFRKGDKIRQQLLDKPVALYANDDSSTRTVMTTWRVTVDRIEAENPLAIEILRFMSLLDPEQIMVEIIHAAPKFRDTEEHVLAESIGLLLSYALLTYVGSGCYRLHRLVSIWTEHSISPDQKQNLIEAISRSLLDCLPDDLEADLSKCSRMMPHCLAISQHRTEQPIIDNADLMLRLKAMIGDIWRLKGQFIQALEFYQDVLDSRETMLGANHLSTIETVHQMAFVFHHQGQYQKALEWYQRALDGHEKALGDSHPETLLTIHNMAVVFRYQGQYDKALEWHKRVLAGREKVLGNDHLSTLSTVHSMAVVFRYQRQYSKALEWHQRVLSGREKALGKDHPSTLSTVHCIANVFYSQGQRDQALEWYQRALDGQEKALGKDHPSTLLTVNNLGILFEDQRLYDKALTWYQRALDGREKVLGKSHPDTLRSAQNVADIRQKQKSLGYRVQRRFR